MTVGKGGILKVIFVGEFFQDFCEDVHVPVFFKWRLLDLTGFLKLKCNGWVNLPIFFCKYFPGDMNL